MVLLITARHDVMSLTTNTWLDPGLNSNVTDLSA
jgi:hypothetical protein